MPLFAWSFRTGQRLVCPAVGVRGEDTPFFLIPNGLAVVEAAAGFAPASPTVVDMMTKDRRKLSCQSLEPGNRAFVCTLRKQVSLADGR